MGSTRFPESFSPMSDILTTILSKHLRFADVSAVADLARVQLRKRRSGSGPGEDEPLERVLSVEFIRHCEEAAEFCAATTTGERREEIAAGWYKAFESRVDKALARAGEKCGLTAADLDIVRGEVLDPFFTEDSLRQVLGEDSLAIYACDLRNAEQVYGWLESDSTLAVFLFERGVEQAEKDRGRRRGYLRRGVEGRVARCLELLNGLINDPEPWPKAMMDLVPMREETQQASEAEVQGTWERRRLRRMLLNDLFERALEPRMGYSPRLGTLRWYLENRLLASRLPDAIDRYIRARQRGGTVEVVRRNEYPLLNEDQIVAPAGFMRALADPASVVGRIWMEAIAGVDPALAERCRMVRDGGGVGGADGGGGGMGALPLSDLVRCLNGLIAGRAVIPPGAAESEPGMPAVLRAFLALAPRAYRLVDEGLAVYNRRTLEIGFRGWIPEPAAVVWDEVCVDEEDEEDEEEDGGAVPDLLEDPYLRAVLDLYLVTRIPPDRMGRATRTGLAWYGSVEGTKIPGILDELVRWFQVEHQAALRAWEELGERGGKDERDREAQEKAVAEGEELLGRVADPTVREVIGKLDPKAARRTVGVAGARLRELLREVAREVEIGRMDEVLKEFKQARGGRGAMEAAGVVEYARATVRLARAEARVLVNAGERKAFENHDGRWVRSQKDVGRYLGRHQSTVQRALQRRSGGLTLLRLATGFAELRQRGHAFPNEDADPVGPGRGAQGQEK